MGLTTRVLLAIAALLVLVLDNDLAELLLLLLLDRLSALLDHVHLLAVLHHLSKIIVRSKIGNAVFLQHFASLYRGLDRSLVATCYCTPLYNLQSKLSLDIIFGILNILHIHRDVERLLPGKLALHFSQSTLQSILYTLLPIQICLLCF